MAHIDISDHCTREVVSMSFSVGVLLHRGGKGDEESLVFFLIPLFPVPRFLSDTCETVQGLC